jgi:hypothetical protein
MTYQTHAYLGKELFPVICETWNVTLSRKRLIRGSIKPDMSSLFLRYPHFWKYSHKFVEKKMRKLARMTLVPGKKNGRFSENLGIVLHYVADYFTAVHNVNPNPLREHMEYETRLYQLFQEYVNSESLRNSMRMVSYGINPAEHGPKHALRTFRESYTPSVTDPANDIRSITIACLAVTTHIMDAVMVKADAASAREKQQAAR